MSGKSINFGDKKISKSNFYKNNKIFKIEDIDVNKILVSKKESCSTKNSSKYIILYNDGDDIIRLYIKLPQMIGCAKYFDSNKVMSFKVSVERLFKKCNKIWERVGNLMNTEFDSEPVCGDNDKYIKTKIKSCRDLINTNFQGKKIAKENASCKCLSMILLESVIRANKKYYPQTLLEECKYEIKKNKMKNLINDDLDLTSSDEPDSESDNEFDNGSNNETDN